jgi:hypothetical protein
MPTWHGCETHYSSAGGPAPGCAMPTLPENPAAVSVAYICGLRRECRSGRNGRISTTFRTQACRPFFPPGLGRLPVGALTGGRGRHAVLPAEERAFPHCQSQAASKPPLRLLELTDGSGLPERPVAGVAAIADMNGRPLITLGVSKSRLRAGWPRPHRFQAGRLSAGEERHLRPLPERVIEVVFMLYSPARSR